MQQTLTNLKQVRNKNLKQEIIIRNYESMREELTLRTRVVRFNIMPLANRSPAMRAQYAQPELD
jgi:hypothetical protein